MAKYWVVMAKYAGVEIEAENEDEAEEKAYNTPESELQLDDPEGKQWEITSVFPYDQFTDRKFKR